MDYIFSAEKTGFRTDSNHIWEKNENKTTSDVNNQLIGLGKKDYMYHYEQTMDRCMADFNTKKVLMNLLNATSQESVPEHVKKVCYKGYPEFKLPVCDTIIVV